MQVNIELPEDVSQALQERWGDVSRRSLEAIALEGYWSGALTESQVRRLLGFETRMEVHAFLKQAGVPLHYTKPMSKRTLRPIVNSGSCRTDDRHRR
jgi:hypothetical protein